VRVCGPACAEVVPETETLPADYEVFKYKQFAKRSLLTKSEVIDALVKVKNECNKVAQMSLFHVPVIKSMRLEEFEHAQSQVSSQVSEPRPPPPTHTHLYYFTAEQSIITEYR